MTEVAALDIRDLGHAYSGRPILSAFNLAVPVGSHTVLLGPSGSGKTTLINLVTGLLTPDAGTIMVGGEHMTGSAAARDDLRRRRIGIIFQTLRLVAALSVVDNLRLAQRLSGQRRDDTIIDHLLDGVGLSHRRQANPRQLSQGEAQRAAIARALVGKPDILIADEPTSALDDLNAKKVAEMLIRTSNARGSTLLIATHDARLKAHFEQAVTLKPFRVVA